MCEYVWLMIVVVCVSSLGEEYVCAEKRDLFSAVIICFVFYFIFLNPVCLLLSV